MTQKRSIAKQGDLSPIGAPGLPDPICIPKDGETLGGLKLRAKNRAKPTHKESNLQKECVSWFKSQYRKYENNLIAVPNGGKRSLITAMHLKAEGVRAGTPDIFIAVPRPPQYAGLWVEMKVKGNTTTPNQKLMIQVLTNAGYKCEVCYTFDEFQNIINSYLK